MLPDVVDVEALGWWWGLRQGDWVPAHGSQLFLRSTADSLDMVLTRDGAPLLFRSLSSPPSRGTDLEAVRAEWLGDCTEEVAYALTSVETEWGGADTPTLHVFHAEEVTTEWAESLKEALALETLFIHPLENLPTASEGVARRLAEPTRLLAMDLAPEAWREADLARRSRRKLLRAATVFVGIWLFAIGIFWTWFNLERGRMNQLRAQVESLEGPAQEIRILRAKVREFTQYADRSHSALECLRIVSETLPKGADLNKFIYRKGKSITLQGIANTTDDIYEFNNALKATTHFQKVDPGGITSKGSQSQFGVNIVLLGAEEEGS